MSVPTPPSVWGNWHEITRYALKEAPIIVLLALVAWRLPAVQEKIKEGYMENAASLKEIILIQQADYEKRESQHIREMERVQAQLNAEMNRYQALISEHLELTNQRVDTVEELVTPKITEGC